MWTYCDNYWQWKTESILYNYAEIYVKQKWYSNSTSNLIWNINTTQIFNHVKSEIDLWNSIIINVFSDDNISWHSVVAFWYKSNSNKIFRVEINACEVEKNDDIFYILFIWIIIFLLIIFSILLLKKQKHKIFSKKSKKVIFFNIILMSD